MIAIYVKQLLPETDIIKNVTDFQLSTVILLIGVRYIYLYFIKRPCH